MQILIPSTDSTVTIFLILLSPYVCIWLRSLKITSTQDRLCVLLVTSSMNSLSSSSFLDMDRDLFFRHRSWTWTESYSFEQDTSPIWCHSETSVVKAGPTTVWDHVILPPTVSGDDTGVSFFSTHFVLRWRWCTLRRLLLTFLRHVLKRLTSFLKIQLFFPLFYGGGLSVKTLRSHGGVGWELRRLY